MKAERKKINKGMPEFLVGLTSLGCPKNFVDTEIVAGSFLASGKGQIVPEGKENIRFINTCSFLASAREEAFANIEEALCWKKKKKGRKVIVGGCLVSLLGQELLEKKYPAVDLFLGLDEVEMAPSLLENAQNHKALTTGKFIGDDRSPRLPLTPPHYAYLKIADGCDNCCAYCLIPTIRGSLRSRSMDSILKEAGNLLSSGVKELIVIAQDTSGYGRDREDGASLAALLPKLDAFPGDYRIRLMYLHPAGITEELVKVMKKTRHLIPFLEMPLQHIAENVLRKMGRKIFEEETKKRVALLRENGFEIRTTFLVGFPGETQADFDALLSYVKEMQFTRLGVFAFSPEEGTRAFEMEGAVPEEVAEERRNILLEEQEKISLKRNENLVGKEIPVWIDFPGDEEGLYVGRTNEDAPEIDGLVYLISERELLPGEKVMVKVTACDAYDLTAEEVILQS